MPGFFARNGTDLIITTLLFGGVAIYISSGWIQKRNERKYEEALLARYRDLINIRQYVAFRINAVIPLSFPNRGTEFLLNLCINSLSKWLRKHYVNANLSRQYQPRLEVQNVGFRRIKDISRTIDAQMIRCNEIFALMDAGDGKSGYVLEKDNFSTFYIMAKFDHGFEAPTENLPTLVDHSIPGQPTDNGLETPRPA